MIKRFFNNLALAASMLLTRLETARGLSGCANTLPDNYDANVQVHECSVRKTIDVAATSRHLLWTQGADAWSVTIAGANALPMGTIDNVGTDVGTGQSLLLLGKGPTKKMVIAGAVNPGVYVYTAAGGTVSQLSGTAGTYYQVGIALRGGNTAGDIIEVLDHVPIPVVVS
jgi:hypothetical protein